jgi:hypothetical protein
MIRHGALSPFITDITNPGEEQHSSPKRDGIYPRLRPVLSTSKGLLDDVRPPKSRSAVASPAIGAAGRPSRLWVFAAIADAGPIG